MGQCDWINTGLFGRERTHWIGVVTGSTPLFEDDGPFLHTSSTEITALRARSSVHLRFHRR